MKLEKLVPGVSVSGIKPDCLVEVIQIQRYGTEALELTYRDPEGEVASQILYRYDEERLNLAESGRPWSFDGDGKVFRLVSEARRIRLAHLFDPLLAVHSSIIEPLPHQITAVYECMLPRQPLRFLLADDPGAGKTIMAGLLIKELIARGDLQRCLVVCPGSLAEQWQDELYRRFHLPFDILTNEGLESARTGNWFQEHNLVIARLDKLSRNPDVQEKLSAESCRWDLIVCDEAHKMSATFTGGEVKYTKRYKLGQKLSMVTRHFLLMTATPHNGKEADFQLFMALIDNDRFEGGFRLIDQPGDSSDMMRRMVKENLLKFDATPLFPERRAYTVPYRLTDDEADLYAEVTDYVREEFNRAEALQNNKRRGTVGFALTTLQRRLASSPEAIHQSLRRRKERLESRLSELQELPRDLLFREIESDLILDEDDLDDLDDAPDVEVEEIENQVLDQATAAQTSAELEAEIEILRRLEELALKVKYSGQDKKWQELSGILTEIFTTAISENQFREAVSPFGSRPSDRSPHQKLVIFTEHRDTLNYLTGRIRTLLGNEEAVVVIHGGVKREERLKVQEQFRNDPDVKILVATDAAGEGINLQRAHLMVNYDLPWNPNRLEQRFGRIHRIGQEEVCHLWNLVAEDTREGNVYRTLLDKLDEARAALGGQVFDVLGKVIFDGRPLRDLMIEAIRDGDRPEIRARLQQIVSEAFNREHLQNLMEDHALARDVMDARRVYRVKEEMERANARRLQPHYIESFFLEAFRSLGGEARLREPRRYELVRVPAELKQHNQLTRSGEPLLSKYERIVFEKELIHQSGKPMASFVFPGHPLLDTSLDLILQQHPNLLRRGAILIDESDFGIQPRVLFYLEHSVRDGRVDEEGRARVISRQMLYIEINNAGDIRPLQYAPYLDFRPLEEDDPMVETILAHPECNWISSDLEQKAKVYAISTVVQDHLEKVRNSRNEFLAKTEAAVKERLTKEIGYWDHRAEVLREQEAVGKRNARLNSNEAGRRASDLQVRLERRLQELELEKHVRADAPIVTGGLLIIPKGLIVQIRGERVDSEQVLMRADTQAAAARAREIIMEVERGLGFEPWDREFERLGYDIESRDPSEGRLRFIEVKGRQSGAATITVTRNEILYSLNKPDDYILAIVEFMEGGAHKVHYIRRPFQSEPDFGVTSVNYNFAELLEKSEKPS